MLMDAGFRYAATRGETVTARGLEIRPWLLALVALGLGLPLLVVWSVHFPPQVDGPNHVARHYLESLHLRGAPLPPGYEVAYRILPNLGADLVLPPLMWVLEPLAAWKVFLSLSLTLYWLGPALFILQEGGYRPPAWIAAVLLLPFVLSSAFFWGFLNYYSGVGLAFLAAAHLRHLDRAERPEIAGLLLHAPLVALLFLWHLAAVFIYGVLAGCIILARLWTLWRAGSALATCLARVALLCLPMLPVVALYLAYAADAGGAPALAWAGAVRKLLLALTLFRGYDMTADLMVTLLWAGALLAFFGRSLRAASGGTAALATGAFLVLYIAMPTRWGTTSGADTRMLPALLACALAWLGTLPARWSWAGAGLLAASLTLRSGEVWHAWQRLDERLRDAAGSFAHVERGASVLPVILSQGSGILLQGSGILLQGSGKEDPEDHLVSLAVIERHAYVPSLFALRDQQPLRLTGETALTDPLDRLLNPLARRAGSVEDGVFTLANEADAARYDYLWILNPNRLELRLPADWVQTFAGERVSLWRIGRPRSTREPQPDG